MSKPHASSPQTALADVEQRIVAAAKEREETASEAGAHTRTAARRRACDARTCTASNVSPTSTLPP